MENDTVNRRLAAFCEVLDLLVEWMESARQAVDDEREALAAARSAIAAPTPRSQRRAYEAWVALTAAHEARPSAAPRHDFREAVLLVCRGSLASEAELTDAALGAAERVLLTHAVNVGAGVGVRDAARLARVAFDAGRKQGRKPSRFPEPGFAKQAALGASLRLARSHARMDPKALCAAAALRGCKLSPAALTRYENGHHGADAPTDVLAACVGLTGDVLRARADIAHRMAQELAVRHGVGDRERWFAEVVAVDDETAAREYIGVGATAASRVDDPERVR